MNKNTIVIWDQLVQTIQQQLLLDNSKGNEDDDDVDNENGRIGIGGGDGYIHPNLILRNILDYDSTTTTNNNTTPSIGNDDNNDNNNNNESCLSLNRGIFCQAATTTKTTTTTTNTTSTTTTIATDTNNVDCRSRNNDNNNNNNNNKTTTKPIIIIRKGELLIRIPESKAIHGRYYPSFYYNTNNTTTTTTTISISTNAATTDPTQNQQQETKQEQVINNNNDAEIMLSTTQQPIKRYVSTWLRCLTSYYEAYSTTIQTTTITTTTVDKEKKDPLSSSSSLQPTEQLLPSFSLAQAYINSLPISYETIWNWSDYEIMEYLSGTTIPTSISQFASTTTSSTSTGWKNDPCIVKERYQNQIRPYLLHVIPNSFHKIQQYLLITTSSSNKTKSTDISSNTTDTNNSVEELELQFFRTACQVLSTRCFHLKDEGIDNSDTDIIIDHPQDSNDNTTTKTVNDNNNDSSTITQNTNNNNYDGPFLLPVIDLLNHTSDPKKKCTTLHRISSSSISYFIMIAERDIYDQEEILHSYGTELHSNQFLQTFGFIPSEYVQRSAQSTTNLPSLSTIKTTIENNLLPNSNNTTTTEQSTHQAIDAVSLLSSGTQRIDLPRIPIVLSKDEIIQVCNDYIQSGVSQRLQEQIQQQAMLHETWDVVVPIDTPSRLRRRRQQLLDSIPDTILLSQSSTSSLPSSSNTYKVHYVLPDELITLCCILVLPDYVIEEELTDGDLLDATILQDYYLGHLVYGILLHYIRTKLELYQPISSNTIKELFNNIPIENVIAEQSTTIDPDVALINQVLKVQNDPNIDTNLTAFEKELINTKRNRLLYGLTIRIEEKVNWICFCNDIIYQLSLLRTEDNAVDSDEDNSCDDDEQYTMNGTTKRIRYK